MEGVVATRGRSGVAVSADGEVSVNREVTMAAMARDEEGNVAIRMFRQRTRQVIGQVSGIFAIAGSVEQSSPTANHSVDTPHQDDKTCTSTMVCVGIIFTIFGALSVAMVVFGILDYNLCPGHTRLAIFMIAQGATSFGMPILASCWCCCKCISGKCTVVICAIIVLFNIGWGIVGFVWMAEFPCKDTFLYIHALGFSVPLWILICLMSCCCIGFVKA
ncbi:uncharacterized protein [Haliotis asinina]|uniref:uncharacterized protein n=1 Tax=Haliotis asinina TaxID=109174 RepID=UPI0035321529